MVRFSDRRARFNRRVTNRIFRPVSGYLPIWSIVEHTGRRSGTIFKNITSAGHARIRRHGKTIEVSGPRVVSKAEAAEHVTGAMRRPFARLPFEQAVLLKKV